MIRGCRWFNVAAPNGCLPSGCSGAGGSSGREMLCRTLTRKDVLDSSTSERKLLEVGKEYADSSSFSPSCLIDSLCSWLCVSLTSLGCVSGISWSCISCKSVSECLVPEWFVSECFVLSIMSTPTPRSLYRKLYREIELGVLTTPRFGRHLPPPLTPYNPCFHNHLRDTFRATSADDADAVRAGEETLLFLQSKRMHRALLERYNGPEIDSEDRLRRSARRVGLELPRGIKSQRRK